jgi:hypothetical protein|tara:strand:+ start:2895 stop:3155 length:261 start_codon:yes stop_codon:yes gene_type:complete
MYSLDFKVGDIVTLYSYNNGNPKVITGIVVGDRFQYDVPEWIIETNERRKFFAKGSKSPSLVGGRGILKGRFTLEEFIEAVKNEGK